MAKDIFVLNDTENSLDSLIESLSQNGYAPHSTNDADDCVELLDQWQPLAIIVSLKTIGALDSVQAIRMDPNAEKVPIIFLGNEEDDANDQAAAEKQGGAYYLQLPLEDGQIIEAMEVLGTYHGSRRLHVSGG